MGINTFPAVVSPIKSLQRGTAAAAGNITISSVVVAKTTVNSFSTGSAGSVAATGTVAAANGTTSGISFSAAYGTNTISTNANLNYTQMQNNQGYAYYYPTGNYNARYQAFYQTGTGYAQNNLTSNIAMNGMNTNGANVALNSQTISGGSTSLTAASYGAYLVDSVTIYATGPCQYEVIEYY